MSLIVLILFVLFGTAQTSDKTKNPIIKVVESKRRVAKIKLDGVVDSEEWAGATLLDNYVELRPNPGKLESDDAKMIAYLVYDNEGIYFGGICYESSKDMISSELVGKDGFGNNDFVGIIFDTYKDNLNAFEYFVTPLNEQMDAKQFPNPNGNSEDFSWNSVWQSATKINENSWSFEMFIPFASIRFSDKKEQDWGLNVVRRRQKTGQQLFWNPIDPKVNGFLTQEGYLTGLKDIKPPVRLQLSPYISYYANHYPLHHNSGDLTSQFNGGMDLKWGINQAFTLDATLVPDFGQVQSDPQVFNLSPFEVRFNENRAFFTEGTELFNQGNLFYSRRIGGTPINYWNVADNLNANEKPISNPSESKLLNASKISGRTQNGLGVGILNAITRASSAEVRDTLTGQRRTIETDPVTNYNVFILNKSLKNNSSLSFINTNVTRSGSAYDANVTGLIFNLNDKSNTWNTGGQLFSSQLTSLQDEKNSFGYSHVIYAGKTNGTYRFNLWQELADTKYTSNDLGFYTNNNFIEQGIWIGINQPKPTSWRNQMNTNININYSRLLKPIGTNNPMYQFSRINVNTNGQLKNLHWFGLNGNVNFDENDFYEPSSEGSYFKRGGSAMIGAWLETNNAKSWSINPELFIKRFFDFYDATAVDMNLNQNWRVNERLSLRLGGSYQPRFNNVGFADYSDSEETSVFAKRDIQTFETSLRGKYNFTNRMGITLVARHYVSSVKNKQLFYLQKNGTLNANDLSPEEYNRTANFFNIDMVYTWQIAQGSFVSIVWKFAVNRFDEEYRANYIRNLSNTLGENQNNNLSVRLIYFLDYNTVVNKRRG